MRVRAGPPPPKTLQTGVPEDQIIGIRYGLRGFYEKGAKPLTLTRAIVDGIHLKGGTMLVGPLGLECRGWGFVRVSGWWASTSGGGTMLVGLAGLAWGGG